MAIDFQEKSESYEKLKKDLENARREVEAIETKMDELSEKRKAARGKTGKDASEELKEIQAEYYKTLETLREKRDEVKGLEASIDEIIAEVSKDPSVKGTIDAKLDEQYGNKMAEHKEGLDKLLKDKDEQESMNATLQKIKDFVKESPENEQKLVDFIKDKKEYIELKAEEEKLLNTVKLDDKQSKRLGEIHHKMKTLEGTVKTKRKDVVVVAGEKGIKLTEEEIDNFAKNAIENGLSVDKNGKIDLSKTLDNNEKRIAKRTRDLNNRIRNKENIIESYSRARAELEPDKSEKTDKPEKSEGEATPPAPVEKPKWYQLLVKRFRQWRESRREEPEERGEGTEGSELSADARKTQLYKDIAKERESETKGKREGFLREIRFEQEVAKIDEEHEAQVRAADIARAKKLKEAAKKAGKEPEI